MSLTDETLKMANKKGEMVEVLCGKKELYCMKTIEVVAAIIKDNNKFLACTMLSLHQILKQILPNRRL